jgi:hypothetical protein
MLSYWIIRKSLYFLLNKRLTRISEFQDDPKARWNIALLGRLIEEHVIRHNIHRVSQSLSILFIYSFSLYS